MTEPTPDSYYTPARVRDLLRLYAYLGQSRPPTDPDMLMPLRRCFGPGGWQEEAMAKRGDIGYALAVVKARDWRAEYVLRAYYAVGLSLRDISGYLAREYGVVVSHETVRRWCHDGVEVMAIALGWRDR